MPTAGSLTKEQTLLAAMPCGICSIAKIAKLRACKKCGDSRLGCPPCAAQLLGPARRKRNYRFKIQLEIFSSATGDIVSSICAYSAGDPVFAVWNK